MSSANDGSPMRWDPQARGGAGGWVEGPGTTPAPQPAPWQGPGPMPGPAPGPPPMPGTAPMPGPAPVPGPQPPYPPYPEPGPEPEPGPPRTRAALIAVAVLLAVAAVAAVVVVRLNGDDGKAPVAVSSAPPPSTSSGSQPPSPDPTDSTGTADAAGQAAAVDALLDTSAADRQKVVDAVQAVAACDSVADAQTALTEAADNREKLLSQLDALSLDLVDGGPAALTELRTAWQHSAEADRAFADWALSAEGCTTAADVSQDADYDSGVSHSEQATAAKQAFIARWNPIAGEYGLSTRTETGI